MAAEEWSSFSAGKAPELGLRRPQLAQELANVRSAEAELENARRNAETILTESEVVKNLVAAGKLKVIYATYDIDSGVVEFHG